ncbi:MAG TPA: gamma-glutamylcyclotransferase [Gemmatimonadales bacterium]|nr:gamma-glutamylcyclotransferase [Gemmatimonadales bacterium]
MLWELPSDDELALDAFEGVAEGLYRKAVAIVHASDGRAVSAMLYLPTDPSPGRPRSGA